MYFVIKKSANGQYYFVIKSNNSQVVATSETYTSKQSAENTIDSIKTNIDSDSSVIDISK
ncbi:YegP family protein [Virgibacillus litoralis]|uniref:Uncharacterized protein YegP (UPF0339 family) n=1 Tax=Virgibacillus litoralis TaxID=578221 RepID=A0ABS4HH87_9BACI|nr:uncharacterized protein YegP (UPF0339 family) [Virgibacillus litoralis]